MARFELEDMDDKERIRFILNDEGWNNDLERSGLTHEEFAQQHQEEIDSSYQKIVNKRRS